MVTIEDLLHGFVAHLRGSEALQGHNGGVGPVAQQQTTGLDVARQRCPVECCLTQRVHCIHLEAGETTSVNVEAKL